MKARTVVVCLAFSCAWVSGAGAQTLVSCDNTDANKAAILGACNTFQAPEVFSTINQIVCIDVFQYNPPMVSPMVGQTVAWVNVETCNTPPAESTVASQTGCDTHHQVRTVPDIPQLTGDTLNFVGICSPSDGIRGPAVSGTPPKCQAGETNVRCHTFGTSGTQHYTCETNPGHTALMHGLINVQAPGYY